MTYTPGELLCCSSIAVDWCVCSGSDPVVYIEACAWLMARRINAGMVPRVVVSHCVFHMS